MYFIGLEPVLSSYRSSSLITKVIQMKGFGSPRKRNHSINRDPIYKEHGIESDRNGDECNLSIESMSGTSAMSHRRITWALGRRWAA